MTVLFGWQADYVIDNGEIDRQHKHLLKLVNTVLTIVDPIAEVDAVRTSVKALFQYMEFHFRAEEEFMEKIEYPELAAQRQSHAKLVQDMTALLKNSKNYTELYHQLKDTAAGWVLHHIQQEDAKIGAYLREKEVQPA